MFRDVPNKNVTIPSWFDQHPLSEPFLKVSVKCFFCLILCHVGQFLLDVVNIKVRKHLYCSLLYMQISFFVRGFVWRGIKQQTGNESDEKFVLF